MKISVTGTFNVPRKDLEKQIIDMGHTIVDLSAYTEILLVGEKTASPKKINKAEAMRIKIIRETDAIKILPQLSGLYRDHYERNVGEDGSGEEITVGLLQVNEAYKDFAHVNADAGEWHSQDIEAFLKGFDSAENHKIFCDWIKIKINPEEEADFWKVLRRLMILDYVSWEQCQYDGEPVINIRQLATMPEEVFAGKVLNLSLFDFSDAETRQEYLKGLSEDEIADIKRILELK